VRLGHDDDWASAPGTNWVSDSVHTSKQTEDDKYEERKSFVEAYNKKIDAEVTQVVDVTSASPMDKYKAMMQAHPYPASIVQSILITLLGYLLGEMIKGGNPTQMGVAKWAGWGIITVVISLPFLTWLSGITFATSKTANGVCKSLFNQATIAQFLNALFISYMALWEEKDPMVELEAKYVGFALTAMTVWLPSDLINLTWVPIEGQLLWNGAVSLGWTAYLALMS